MKPQDRDHIIAEFTNALDGRYGPLKPAQGVEEAFEYIKGLRSARLSWSTIEDLFNTALARHDLPGLATGSLSRLFLIALRRPLKDKSSAATPSQEKDEGNHASNQHGAAGAVVLGATAQAGASDREPKRTGTAGAQGANPHLARIQQRRADERRMDEA